MSDSSPSSKASTVFFAAGLFLVFGFLVLILSNFADQNSLEERAYMGDFDQATTDARWENLKVVEEAQSTLFSEEKVAKAMAAIAKAESVPSATEAVVPGSPTFLKQMEASAEESKPTEATAEDPEASDTAKPAPEPAPEPKAPEAGEDKPKAPDVVPEPKAPEVSKDSKPEAGKKAAKAAPKETEKPDKPKAEAKKAETPEAKPAAQQ